MRGSDPSLTPGSHKVRVPFDLPPIISCHGFFWSFNWHQSYDVPSSKARKFWVEPINWDCNPWPPCSHSHPPGFTTTSLCPLPDFFLQESDLPPHTHLTAATASALAAITCWEAVPLSSGPGRPWITEGTLGAAAGGPQRMFWALLEGSFPLLSDSWKWLLSSGLAFWPMRAAHTSRKKHKSKPDRLYLVQPQKPHENSSTEASINTRTNSDMSGSLVGLECLVLGDHRLQDKVPTSTEFVGHSDEWQLWFQSSKCPLVPPWEHWITPHHPLHAEWTISWGFQALTCKNQPWTRSWESTIYVSWLVRGN